MIRGEGAWETIGATYNNEARCRRERVLGAIGQSGQERRFHYLQTHGLEYSSKVGIALRTRNRPDAPKRRARNASYVLESIGACRQSCRAGLLFTVTKRKCMPSLVQRHRFLEKAE